MVFVLVGYIVKSQKFWNGVVVWVEVVILSKFIVCIFEFGIGFNKMVEVNWFFFQVLLGGFQIGIVFLSFWIIGMKCKRIDFLQVSIVFFI